MQAINPFQSKKALNYSNYHILNRTGYKKAYQSEDINSAETLSKTSALLRNFILTDKHPCVIARSAMRSESCRFGVYPSLGSQESTAGLSRDLIHFLKERPGIKNPFASFMAIFQQPVQMTEEVFEDKLWQQLHLLRQASMSHYTHDKKTSPDPGSDKFGFSFGGESFYVVGMHPNSSRLARQFAYPMLVFNLHEQFEVLRASGKYDRIKSVVRKNDLKLQGSVNPMLRDFGQESEAKQYSGRAVSNSWKCPHLTAISAENDRN